MNILLLAIIILGILGFVFAALLGIAADYFKIDIDPRISAIVAILPGANCGACGQAGCQAFAEKLVKGEVSVSGCTVGGKDVAEKLAKLMGRNAEVVEKFIAAVHCGADIQTRKRVANYSGIETCTAADLINDGGLACSYACLGYGDCYCSCPFDAIRMKDGLPKFDPKKCTACGKCVAACPKQIISLKPLDNPVIVACSSHDMGAVTRKNCPVGCIACKICEKEVPEVFKVIDNLSNLDYTKNGVDCSAAIEKCPTKCILRIPHPALLI